MVAYKWSVTHIKDGVLKFFLIRYNNNYYYRVYNNCGDYYDNILLDDG